MLLAAIFAVVFAFTSCDSAGGESGAPGTSAPGFITGTVKVATINYALQQSPVVVLDTVTISDGLSGAITVPAGKTLKIVGAVTTSQNILVNALAGTLDTALATDLGDAGNDVYLVTKANAETISPAVAATTSILPGCFSWIFIS